MSINPYDQCCKEIIRYLSDRRHTEAPHISTVSPDFILENMILSSSPTQRPTLVSDEDEGTDALEDVEFMRGTSVFGVQTRFKDLNTSSRVVFKVSFYVRYSLDEGFRRIQVVQELIGGGTLRTEVSEIDDAGNKIHASEKFFRVKEGGAYRIGIGNNQALRTILPSEVFAGSECVIDESTPLIDALTLDVKDVQLICKKAPGEFCTDKDLRCVTTFIMEFFLKPGSVVRFNLRHIGCIGFNGTEPISVYYMLKEGDKHTRSSVRHLFEVRGELQWQRTEPAWEKTEFGLKGIVPIGCLLAEDGTDRVVLQDWAIAKEKIPKIVHSEKIVDSSLRELAPKVSDTTVEILRNAIEAAYGGKIKQFFGFQEEALQKILSELTDRKTGVKQREAFVIQARTAGGKTLAFLLPILAYLTELKVKKQDRNSVKVFMFYPTVALANDQADEIIRLLYYINRQLHDSPPISLGILNQYTPARYQESTREPMMRIDCPVCGSLLRLESLTKEGKKGINYFLERVCCSNKDCVLSFDPALIALLNASFRFSREAIYSSRPDIVITTPDYINHRLTLSGPEDPNSLLLLGKPGYYCKDCGKTYTEVVRSCRDGCGGTPIQTQSGKPPIAIVIDEAHLFRGEFGAQVAHLFLRLEHAIRRLYGLKGWRPLYILSSATLSSPTDRASELTTCDRKNIEVIEPQYHEEETTYRNHIVILPKTYTALASVERALEVPYGMTCALRSVSGGLEDPRTLVFVNSISNANDLINTLQRMLSRGGVRVGGHTTDYHDERAAVEDAFLRGELDILVATRGLEVGVDFDRVNIGVIFGMPFYLSEYVQRIGRIGRKGDSIIINVLTPDRNINYYYYMNCHLLTDSSFREQHMRQEASVIKVDNPVALKRFAQRAIFDWFSVEYPFNRAALDVTAKDRIIEYILACIAPLRLSHEEEERVRDEAQQYIERNLGHLFSWETKAETIIKELRRHTHGGGRLGYLHNLRTFDRQVEIRPDLRTRNLSIMFRRSMRGMIYSFRGRYYVIDTVEHRPAFQLGTSGVEINEWE